MYRSAGRTELRREKFSLKIHSPRCFPRDRLFNYEALQLALSVALSFFLYHPNRYHTYRRFLLLKVLTILYGLTGYQGRLLVILDPRNINAN